jgi:hypothetical protein
MENILVGDEVYSYPNQLFARVEATFPAAVCVRLNILSVNGSMELISSPQLWGADDIENLSICRYCGGRDDLLTEHGTGVPMRVCARCRTRFTSYEE